jgi:hypothetical protein
MTAPAFHLDSLSRVLAPALSLLQASASAKLLKELESRFEVWKVPLKEVDEYSARHIQSQIHYDANRARNLRSIGVRYGTIRHNYSNYEVMFAEFKRRDPGAMDTTHGPAYMNFRNAFDRHIEKVYCGAQCAKRNYERLKRTRCAKPPGWLGARERPRVGGRRVQSRHHKARRPRLLL